MKCTSAYDFCFIRKPARSCGEQAWCLLRSCLESCLYFTGLFMFLCVSLESQKVKKWNRIFKTAEDWFDFASPENGLSASQRAIKICSMTATDQATLVGGAAGEIAILSLLKRSVSQWVTLSDNALNIINHMCPFHDQKSILISSNDGVSRTLDLSSLKISSSHVLPWAINVRPVMMHTALDRKCTA